ncbi:putative uncharacterized protein [Clostridium sp. CAG:411]|jgi:transporter family-2 protein|nr:DMT family transporter [Lachnospiraceae bacterium]CDE43126.1 putative uncharacterized protein [Clostridium sp. CAG:411]
MFGILIALLSGALMSIQGVFNSGATKQTGTWLTAMFVQLTAFLVCICAYYVSEKNIPISKIFHVTPKYLLLGGIIGAFITITVIKSISSLGAARAEMFIVCAQLLVAYLIELLGLFGIDKQNFEWRKCIGILVFLVGVIIFKWK